MGARVVGAVALDGRTGRFTVCRAKAVVFCMSRPTQATLLQALTFANGRVFTEALDRAAKEWTARFPDPQQRLDSLYHTALLRAPRDDERAFANAATADLLWAVFLLPEFQLVR